MERDIVRELTLSQDEVKQAIYYWLKTVKDQPVPDGPSHLTMIAEHPGVGKMKVSWRTKDEIA